MIDEEGRVRITDFGLAALSGHVKRTEISAGTPRYMAPEQLAGHSVNEKSDIYSLGLVLYEMFTGRPAFDADDALGYLRLHQTSEPIPPTAIVPEIDPQIEAVILACLRKDPAERPESALNVAAALPGGDLLAAALDAGQIPTREMLAASAAQGKIDRRLMRRAVKVALAMFGSAVLLGNNTHPIAVHGGVKSPDVLREKATEVARLASFEPTSKNVDCRFFPSADTDLSRFVTGVSGTSLALAIPPEEKLLFHYRESDSPVESVDGEVLSFVLPGINPFHLDSDSRAETAITLDGQGRLLFFESNAPSSKNASFDQNALILASGHNPMSLIPAPALTNPGFYAEQLHAFETHSEISPEQDVRIEIAGSHDCVRYFAVLAESTKTIGFPFRSTQTRWTFVRTIRNTVFLLLLMAALLGAWKNWKSRGDLVGAARFGGFIFALRLLSGLLSTRHIGGYSENIENAAAAAMIALCEGLIVTLFYLAAESYVRRWWPRALGCWSRMLAGKLRDPFVGRDIVIGRPVVFWANLVFLDRRLPGWMGWEARTQLRLFQGLENFLGTRFAVAGVFDSLRGGIYQGLVLLFILVIATWLAGLRRWAALLITWIVGAVMYAPAASHPATAWTLFALGGVGVAVYVLTQWGLVSVLAALLVAGLLGDFPITMDLNAWYAGYGIFAGAAVLGLGAWGLYESFQQSALDTPPL
jgi:serine/threonine-protein kinase